METQTINQSATIDAKGKGANTGLYPYFSKAHIPDICSRNATRQSCQIDDFMFGQEIFLGAELTQWKLLLH
jgi:hypothetical protein